MAENNQEITYIPYGQDEISQQDLMTNLANGVEGYLGSRRWARKDKYRNAWLTAYQDIMNHGLTGASNNNGIWTINHGQETIPLDAKSNLEKEMYQDAAYYIQQQMAKMTPRKKEEEKKKEDLIPFKFKESFVQQLLNNRFGGDSSLFGDPEQGWNTLDARGADGLRGTTERRRVMAKQLELYKKELEGKDYNFEGTSFKDKQDALNKIQAAIDALKTDKESDDIPAFNALGLNYRGFFSNGGNEASTHLDSNGNPYTYNQWNQLQQQQAEAKDKQEAEKLKAQQTNYWSGYKYYDLSKYNGRPLTSEESNVKHLNEIISKDKWSGDEASQIVQAFKLAERNGQLVSITDKNELAKFGPMWKNRVRQLRKINGIEGIYYDTIGKKFVKPYKSGQTPQTSFQDILDKNNPKVKKEQDALAKKMAQDKYLANTEWTPDKTRELIGIAADVASVIDPEPISAAGLALSGTGLRTWNRIFDEDGFTLSDIGHTLLDTGLSALGAIPIVGDTALSARILGKLQKASGWLGAIFAAGSVPQAAKAAWDKVINGKDMTVDDWRAIGNVIMGFTQARRMALNNSAGKVIQRGENIDTNSPTRVQQTAKYFNKDSWNIKQRTGQADNIKGPWYKRAWNYFNDPYKPMEIPKTKTSETKTTTAESAKKIKESLRKKLKSAKGVLEKKVGKKELGGQINPLLDTIIEDFIKNNNI